MVFVVKTRNREKILHVFANQVKGKFETLFQ